MIGLGLTLIHLIGIPVTKLVRESSSFNRADSLRRRLDAGTAVALLDPPILRAVVYGIVDRQIFSAQDEQ